MKERVEDTDELKNVIRNELVPQIRLHLAATREWKRAAEGIPEAIKNGIKEVLQESRNRRFFYENN